MCYDECQLRKLQSPRVETIFGIDWAKRKKIPRQTRYAARDCEEASWGAHRPLQPGCSPTGILSSKQSRNRRFQNAPMVEGGCQFLCPLESLHQTPKLALSCCSKVILHAAIDTLAQ